MRRVRRFALLAGPLLAALPQAGRAQEPAVVTLSELVSRALATHPSLAAAAAARDAAGSAVGVVEAARLPSIGTEAQLTRFAQPMVVAPLHGFDPTSPPAFDRTLAQGNVSLNYTLFDGGARGAQIERARSVVDAASSAAQAATRSLLSDVAHAYLRLGTARALEAAQRSRLIALEGERARAERLLAQGRAARVVVLRAEAALSRARAELLAAEERVRLSERALARLSSVSVDSIAGRPLAPVTWRGDVPADRAALVAGAVRSNADLEGLRARAAAAEATTREARAAWLPAVRLAGRYIEYGSGQGSSTGEWQAGALLSFPIFTGGARGSAVERASADARVAQAEVRAGELRVADALDAALSALGAADARAAALDDAVAQSEEVVRIERLALDSGAGLQTDYLTAEAELLDARAALAEARAAVAVARVDLARISGVLSADWLSANLEAGR